MEYYKFAASGTEARLIYPASVWLSLLTETEMIAFFGSTTQIIVDTALLMSKRNGNVNVTSTRFNDVMTACVAENIFTDDRVAEFRRGVINITPAEWIDGSN